MVWNITQAVRYVPIAEACDPSPKQEVKHTHNMRQDLTTKKLVPVGPRPPRLPSRSHHSWLVDIGKGVVAVSESVLDTLECAEVVSVTAVLRVPMLLAPCLVEDRQGAVVLGSDSIDKGQCVWQCLVVHLENSTVNSM